MGKKNRSILVTSLALACILLAGLVAACAAPKSQAPASPSVTSPAPKPTTSPATTAPPTASPTARKVDQLRLVGSTAGSQSNLVMALWSTWFTDQLKLPSVTLPGGEIEDMIMLHKGDCEVTYSTPSGALEAWSGTGRFQGNKITDFRFLMNWTPPLAYPFFIRGDTKGITKIEDLLSKKVAIAPRGNAGNTNMLLMLEAGYGITPESFLKAGGTLTPLGFTEQRDALADRSMDAVSHSCLPYGVSAYAKPTEETVGVRLIVPSEEAIAKIKKKYSHLWDSTTPGGTYKLEPNPIHQLGEPITIIVRADLPDDLVTKMLDIILKPENQTKVRKDFVNFPDFGTKEAFAVGVTTPWHPAAFKWFKDHGYNPTEITMK